MSWPLVKFGDICKLQNGAAFKPSDWSNKGLPIVRIQNLNNENKPFNYTEKFVPDRFHIDSGDLLFSWSGTPGTSFGAFFWHRGKAYLNQHIFKVTVNDDKIFAPYLRSAINSKLDEIIFAAHGGVGLKHITKGKLEAIQIPLPPLAEQKRIAAILDKADAIRRKRKEAIQLTDTLLKSVFLDMFGDPVTNPKGWQSGTLEDYVNLNDRINYGVVQPGKDFLGGVPLIRSGDIGKSNLNSNNLKQIDPKIEVSYKRSRIVGDEILISCVGTIGGVALVNETHAGYNIARQVIRIRCGEKLNRVFAAHMISSPMIQNYFDRETRTVAQPTLNVLQVKKTPILIPPMEMQLNFLNATKQISKININLEKTLASIAQISASLTQCAFRGELTACDLSHIETEIEAAE